MKVKFYQWRLLGELPVIMKSIKCVTLVSSEHPLIHDVDSFQVQLASSQLPPALAPWINYRTCSTRISGPCLTIGWRKISWRQLLPSGSPSDGLKNEIPINHLFSVGLASGNISRGDASFLVFFVFPFDLYILRSKLVILPKGQKFNL